MDGNNATVVLSDNPYAEPQVTSSDPNERKLARRIRIERRVQNLRRKTIFGYAEQIEPIQKTLLQQQLEKSAEVLEKFINEGDEMVTNVRVASDSREVDRRELEGIGREKVIEQLEAEANLSQELFDEITCKWKELFQYNDPLRINEEMNFQKEKCVELVKQKDAIIAMLRDEIRLAEIKFETDQRKQNEDIQSLTQRLEKQVKLLRKAYSEEVKLIEEVILVERKYITEVNDKKWEDLYTRRENEEQRQMEKKFEQHEEFMVQMDQLRLEYEERFRQSKIELENSVENIQQTFEKIKAMALINGEKLDYNYQILRKREDENLIINSEQKRRINKLQDAINDLRKKIRNYDAETKTDTERLTVEVKNLQKCVVEMENKAVSLSKINDLKYKQIWELNIENAQAVLNKILTIDRILHEQQLGLVWRKPEATPLLKGDLPSYVKAKEIVASGRRLSAPSKRSLTTLTTTTTSSKALSAESVSYRNLLRHIMRQISAKTECLVEARLNGIIQPYLEEERTFVKVDNIFNALGVTDAKDIDILFKYFLRYTRCDICIRSSGSVADPSVSYQSSYQPSVVHFEDGVSTEMNEFLPTLMKTVQEPEEVIEEIMTDVIEEEDVLGWPSSHSVFSAFTTDISHDQSGSSVDMVSSLASKLSHKYTTISRLILEVDIKLFWQRYMEIFSDSRERVWDGLQIGLKKYYAILRDRKKLNDEVICLRKRNTELKRLLARYTSGKEKKPPCAEQRELPIKAVPLEIHINGCMKSKRTKDK